MESCVQTYDSRLENCRLYIHMESACLRGKSDGGYLGTWYADVLSYLKQTGLFPRNIYVCVAEDPLALFETEEDLPQDLGSYLEQYLQNQESAGSGTLFKLGRLAGSEKENHILDTTVISGTEGYILLLDKPAPPSVILPRRLYKQEK